ncbi:MaoC/PaaZ C-terminal domain-containing protein [Micromonospora peucetia]|uniref:MaoC like domain-containing protein n=1 Tax=Micromonospora peucetia TaxID=47871 RepID=A0A1C6USY9_9ACTN|nr:MaoC/PaaZ C-terminal domain-containing protein [Micromonospora peucetia]MCX4387455.1 MaoC/PaaZ C-terminal domain-containing protein [Micromonospora peucetia]WSA34780.1 MaoC/PaaZ C-terminal domain-containing protein [Micromonospora peucetia]SCL57215.1 MaoC like domain-containing protein [Micromonospora peucetia]
MATDDISGHPPSGEATRDRSALAPSGEATHDLAGRTGAGGRERVELPRMPAAGALYRRALLGALPGVGGRRRSAGVPPVELAVGGIAVDRTRLADYDRVCGFRLTDRLPATFPHVMGFPLTLRLMTGPEFPIPLTGVVHVGNRITVHRPISADETLEFTTYAENLRPHDRGRQVDVVLVGRVGGEEVWRGVSTYLGRDNAPGGGAGRDRGERPPTPAGSARWRVEPRVGTEYARVSGDHNPIHTSRLGARLFGFRRPIAHGMWSKARCLAALENRLPDAYTVEVAFKLPVPLPSTVSFALLPDGGFALHDLRGRPHLAGLVR